MQSPRISLIPSSVLAAVFLGTLWSARGPAPRAAAASTREFSAERAVAALRNVLGGDVPHPITSAAHDAVRDRIVAYLQSLGYATQIQRSFACNGYSVCGEVANIIARRPGDPARPGIVLAAHYDSVPAGPGASDDGQGVATLLEVARIIRQEPFKNPPLLLIDDGEEAGLLGAEAFVRDPDLRSAAACVINVEARGTRGVSLLFETSRNNRWLIGQATAAMPRPVTSSLFATIYDRLPNDTDLTVFKRADVPGLNFGVIGNVGAYHTPLDNLRNLSVRSVQHHGDNALAVLRAIGNADLQASNQNAVWFDVLSLFVVRWPEAGTIWVAVTSALALLIASMLLVREGCATMTSIGAGALAFPASLLGTAVMGAAVAWLGRLRADGATWVAYPLPHVAAMWIIGFALTFAVVAVVRRRAASEGLQLGTALSWHALAIALALTLPGASYLFLVPSVVMTLWALVRAFGFQFDGDTAAISAAAAVVFFPLGFQLHDALGAPSLPVIAVLMALVATTVAPFVAPQSLRPAGIAIIAAAALALVSIALPPYTAANPRRLNILHVTDERRAQWTVNGLTPQLRRVAPFRADPEMFPWVPQAGFSTAPAPAVGAPLVQLSVDRDLRGASRTVVFTIRSQRAASRVALLFKTDAAVESIRINGVVPPAMTRGKLSLAPGWHRAVVRGTEATVEVTMRSTRPIECIALDYVYGLPAAAWRLAAARGASAAVPSDDGDVTITMRHSRI